MPIIQPGQLATGSYNISGSFSGSFTGNITGTITGTATSASYAETASFAVSASHEIIKEISSSHANVADTASGLFGTPNIDVNAITASGDLIVPQYIKHKGNETTFINFTNNQIRFKAGDIGFFDMEKDASVPYPATINPGGNRINFRVVDRNTDLLLKTDSEAFKVNLYHAGNQKLETKADGINITGSLTLSGSGHVTASGNISSSATITSNILNIGTRVKAIGSSLEFAGNTLDFVDASSTSRLFKGTLNGAFEAYHAGNKKLETTATGVNITGSLTISGSQTSATEPVEKVDLGKYHIKTQNSHDAGFLGQFGGQLIISSSDFTYKNPLFVIQRNALSNEGLDLWAQKDFYVGGSSFSSGEISTIFSVSGSDTAGRYGEIHLGNELKGLSLQPSIKALGHITASGNISASGIYTGDGSGLTNIPASGIVGLSLFRIASGSVTASIAPDKGLQINTNTEITGSLTVSGSFNAFTLDSDNIVLGKGAGVDMLAGANNNTIIGPNAGANLTTGDNNVFLGQNAGAGITNYHYNTAIGYYAMGSTSDASTYNVAVGYTALRYGSGVIGNIGIGYQALNGVGGMNGDYNIGIGYGAGDTIRDGLNNVFVGKHAGGSINDGDSNIAIGITAGNHITDGNDNISIGNLAGRNLVTGTGNIIIGTSASLASDSSGMLVIGSGSLTTISASLATGDIILQGDVSSSAASTASFGHYVGDGSQLTGIETFPFTGDAVISGSLEISGSFIPQKNDNIVIGRGAAVSLEVGGERNIVIGESSSRGLTTGDDNITIGYHAGRRDTNTESKNIFLGSYAGEYGDQNSSILIGHKNGQYGNGSANVYIGNQTGTGHSGDSGVSNYNVFLGASIASYYGLTNAVNNVAVGYQAGRYFTDNDGNTLIGYQAGHDLRYGDYNILIGHENVGINSTEFNNQLRIGNGTVHAISGSLTTGDLTFASTASAAYFVGSGSGLIGIVSSSHAVTASYILASNVDQPFTNITASGNISGSGTIDITGAATFGGITLTDNNYDANGSAKYRVDGYSVLQNSSTTLKIAGNNYWEKITYGNQDTDQHTFVGDITASDGGNMDLAGVIKSAGSQTAGTQHTIFTTASMVYSGSSVTQVTQSFGATQQITNIIYSASNYEDGNPISVSVTGSNGLNKLYTFTYSASVISQIIQS